MNKRRFDNLKRLVALLLVTAMILPSMAFATDARRQNSQVIQLNNLSPQNENDSISIAVTPRAHDNIGSILTSMGIPFQVIQLAQLRDINVLRGFDAVFINCASGIATHAQQSAPAIRQFVSEGGVVYASDLSAPFLSQAFPGLISFMSNSPSGNVLANVTHPSLAAHLGRNQLNVQLPGGGLIINQITPMATIYLERAVAPLAFGYNENYLYNENTHNEHEHHDDCYDCHNFDIEEYAHLLGWVDDAGFAPVFAGGSPMSASFGYGEGRAYFTAFHHTGGMTADMVLFLEYLISEMQRDYFGFPRTIVQTRNQHSIIVLDRITLDPIVGASVNIGGQTLITDEHGVAFHTVISPEATLVDVTAAGFRRNTKRYVVRARESQVFALERATNDGRPYITMVSDTAELVDLRVRERTFIQGSTQTLNLHVAGEWGENPAGNIYLVQFNLMFTQTTSIQGTPIGSGIFQFSFEPGTELTRGRPVFLVMSSPNGVMSTPTLINIRLMASNPVTEQFGNEFNVFNSSHLALFGDVTGNPPAGAAFLPLFPMALYAAEVLLPIELHIDTTETGVTEIKLTVGIMEAEAKRLFEDDAEWDRFANNILSASSRANRQRTLDRLSDSIASQQKTKVGVSVDFLAAGFAKVSIDNYGNIIDGSEKGGLILKASGGLSANKPFLIGPVPFYFELKFGVEVNAPIELWFHSAESGLSLRLNTDLEVAIPRVTAGVGVGINHIASLGVSGTGRLLIGIAPFTGTFAASGSVNARLLFVINFSWVLASNQWRLWGPQNPSIAAMGFNEHDLFDGATPVSRDYTSRTTPWQGNTTFAPFSAEAASLHALQSWIMPDSLPQLVEVGGTTMILFLHDDPSRNLGDHTVLMYSVNNNGIWSEPEPVWASNTADMFFNHFVVGNELYVVWQKQSSPVTPNAALWDLAAEIAENSEIAFARFNRATNSFTGQTFITNNNCFNMLASVAASGNNITAVWVSNDAADPLGGQGNFTINRSINTGAGFAAPASLYISNSPITELASGYAGNQLRIVFIRNNTAYALNTTGNAVQISGEHPVFSLQYNSGRFYFASQGTIYAFNPVTNAVTQVGNDYALISASYRFVTNQAEQAIVWTEAYDGNYYVKASMYVGGGEWSYPVTLLTTYSDIIDFMDVSLSANNWHVVMGTRDADTDASALVVVNIGRVPDTELVYVFADITEEVNGIQPIHLLFQNLGDTVINAVEVSITSGGFGILAETVIKRVIPGEEVIITVDADVTFMNSVTDFTVFAAAAGETASDNNFVDVQLGHADVSIVLSSFQLGDYVLVTARIANDSRTPANVIVNLIEDSLSGAVVDTRNVGIVNQSHDFIYVYRMNLRDINFGGAPSKAFFFAVHTDVPNRNLVNNTGLIVLYPLADLTQGVGSLPVPVGLNITGTILSWNAVNGSVGYRVYVGGQARSNVITETNFNLAALGLDAGSHMVQVRAIGDGINYANSGLSATVNFVSTSAGQGDDRGVLIPGHGVDHNQDNDHDLIHGGGHIPGPPSRHALSSPTGLAINNSILSWRAVSNSIGYRVYINNRAVSGTITETSFNIQALDLPPGTHTVRVRAIGTGNFSNSSLSEAVNYIAGNIEDPPPMPEPTHTPTIFVNPFVDVSERNWFFNHVAYVYTHGLMTGMGTIPMTFAPNSHITRAMAVQVLYNMEGRPSVAGLTNPFIDVANGTWYRDAVVWAAHNGIVTGFGDGRFAPRDNITRSHLAIILNNYSNFAEMNLPILRGNPAFNDAANIRAYAREPVTRFYRALIINGRPDGRFDPQGNATRAELAAMLHNFLEAAH